MAVAVVMEVGSVAQVDVAGSRWYTVPDIPPVLETLAVELPAMTQSSPSPFVPWLTPMSYIYKLLPDKATLSAVAWSFKFQVLVTALELFKSEKLKSTEDSSLMFF